MNVQFEELQAYIRAAHQSDPIAQYILGARLITGYLLQQDILGGFYWYSESIKSGYIYAKWNAGVMLIEEEIQFKNGKNCAWELIRSAANEGCFDACKFIAESYQYGRHGLKVDCLESKAWEKKCSYHHNSIQFGESFDLENMLGIKLCKPILKYKDA